MDDIENEIEEGQAEEEEFDEDGEDLMKASRKRIDFSDEEDDDEEEDEDEEMNEEDLKFIADDEEEEEDQERRREKKKKRKEKRRIEEEEELSEDELDLINENIGRDSKKKLRRIADGNRDEVEALFDEDDDLEKVSNRDEQMFEDDDLDDFIIRDEEDEAELDEEARIERIKRKKERIEFARNLGADYGISDEALREIEELFGDGSDYAYALYPDKVQKETQELETIDEDGQEIPISVQKKKEVSLKDVYEPSEIAEKMLTEEDEKIRVTDLPERFQKSMVLSFDDSELAKEASIISKALARDREGQEKIINSAVGTVLRFLKKEKFEVPFIWAHRRDYFDGVLSLNDLWKIIDLDEKFGIVQDKKKKLLELIVQLSGIDESIQTDETVANLVEKIITLDDVNDTFAYIHTMYAVSIEQMNIVLKIRRGRIPPPKQLYIDGQKNNVRKFAELFNISQIDYVVSVSSQQTVHFPEDCQEAPLVAAENFLSTRFPTASSVLEAAKEIIAMELGSNPQLRAFIRRIYITDVVINVRPTEKGIKEIIPGHPYFPFKYLTSKPIQKFMDGQFLQILKAESEGLITLDIHVEEEDTLVEDLKKYICNDYTNELANLWNNERKQIIEKAAKEHLFPLTVKWTKERLAAEAAERVSFRCQMALERKIDVAGVKEVEIEKDGTRIISDERPIVLALSWGEGARNNPAYGVILDENGCVVETRKFEKLSDKDANLEDIKSLQGMINQHRPYVLAIGGFKPNTKTILYNIIQTDVFRGLENKSPLLYLVEDEVSRIFMVSRRAQREFPPKDYPPIIPYCVSLGRYVQDPTLETAGLFNKDEDIKHLRLDMLQKYLTDEQLLKSIERGFLNIVNHNGVDINAAVSFPHLSHSLQFVSGLGPRKAQAFVSKILRSSGGKLESRQDLVEKEICAACIFINCASFIRIRSLHFNTSYSTNLDVLDDTRVHPEDYQLARKMAADALDIDDTLIDDDESPSYHVNELMDGQAGKLDSLLLDDYAKELEKRMHVPKKICLKDIKSELQNPYRDSRKAFMSASDQEIFTMLTGESNETLFIGGTVNCIVSRVRDKNLNLTLPSGVEGVVFANNIDIQYGVELSQVFNVGQILNACVIKINYDKLNIELSLRKEDLMNSKNPVVTDAYFDDSALAEEKSGKAYQKKLKRVARTVQHPLWKAVDYKGAEAYLQTRPRGEIIFRPSTKGNDHISVSWKVDDGLYKHIDILELEKPNDWSLGKILEIGNSQFKELDQVSYEYIDPMNRKIARIIDHSKYQKKTLLEMQVYLDDQSLILKRSVYGFILNTKDPGSFYLVYKHPNNSARQENVTITPKGILFRGKEFRDPDKLLEYFKVSEHNKMKAMQKGSIPPTQSMPQPRMPSSLPQSRMPSANLPPPSRGYDNRYDRSSNYSKNGDYRDPRRDQKRY